MTRDGRQNDTPLLLGKYYFSTGINSHLFYPQMDHFLHRCQHDAFYTNKNTLKGVDHPCSTCAKCVTNRLYDPDPCEVCSKWLKNIKEKGVSAEKSGSLWVKCRGVPNSDFCRIRIFCRIHFAESEYSAEHSALPNSEENMFNQASVQCRCSFKRVFNADVHSSEWLCTNSS